MPPGQEPAVMTATAEGENDQDSLGFFAPARVQLTEDIDEEEAEEGKEEKEAGIDVGTKSMQYLKHRGLHGGAIKPSTTAQAQAQAQAQAHAHAPLAPSLSDVQADSLAVRAARVWAWGEPLSPAAGDAYTLTQVLDLWSLELLKSNFSIRKVMLLEYTRCLEQFLWPNFNSSSSTPPSPVVVLTIVLAINEKYRQRLPHIWEGLAAMEGWEDKFTLLFTTVLHLLVSPLSPSSSSDNNNNNSATTAASSKSAGKKSTSTTTPSSSTPFTLTLQSRRFLLIFLINCFQSLENPVIRVQVMKLVGISTWHGLVDDEVREGQILKSNGLIKAWAIQEKKFSKADASTKETIEFQRSFFFKLLSTFFSVLHTIPLVGSAPAHAAPFCERMIELLVDVESQLPTRRYLNVVLHDLLVVPLCRASNLYKRGKSALVNNTNTDNSSTTTTTTATHSEWGSSGSDSGVLFTQLIDHLNFYLHFEIDEMSGQALTVQDVAQHHYSRLHSLQKLVFTKFARELPEFALLNVGKIESPANFKLALGSVSDEVLVAICREIGVRTEPHVERAAATATAAISQNVNNNNMMDTDNDDTTSYSKDFLLGVLCERYAKRLGQMASINGLPLYPDEKLLFDETIIPNTTGFSNTHCLPIPKLNLQFLTAHDHLLRNFNLFRLETAHEIRGDLEDTIRRLDPKFDGASEKTVFGGWSKMGVAIDRFEIVQVGPAKIGDITPTFVKADITFNVGKFNDNVRRDWDSLRPHDVLFLLAIKLDGPQALLTSGGVADVRQTHGLRHVRGCEIVGLVGPDGQLAEEFNYAGAARVFKIQEENFHVLQERKQREAGRNHKHYKDPVYRHPGHKRTYRVLLDVNQYAQDLALQSADGGAAVDIYGSGYFNAVVRRKPQENNFKPVLETIRDLIRTSEVVVPRWLHDVFLGYGDPRAAHYQNMSSDMIVRTIDFRDTFLDWKHLESSFPGKKLVAVGQESSSTSLPPPYILTFPKSMFKSLQQDDDDSEEATTSVSRGAKRRMNGETTISASPQTVDAILVRSYKMPNMGPYPEDVPKKNNVRFTPAQVEAITSGCSSGLTMIVGPPGTGKTDVAVQIIANIYHNYPNQHTLLVTHSNQALNQLFEKITALDIDPRHLLRLGHGQEEIDVHGSSWGKLGRVNSFLEKRIRLLAEVDRMAASLGATGAHGNSCETAGYYFSHHVKPRWESFVASTLEAGSMDQVKSEFPFSAYFSNAPLPLFSGVNDVQGAKEVALGCFRHIEKMFKELDEMRAFELLRSNQDRSNYLLMKEAKIIALTCTHAALKRKELVQLGFKYDNIIVEEAAQILEVESFIPMLLQTPDFEDGTPKSRLKRVVLIGDHHQLPPVVQNTAFQRYGNMEQSLFTRFIRLGTPAIDLDRQGRCRPSLASLFKWNYKNLGDLESIVEATTDKSSVASIGVNPFALANPGFVFDYQVIDVPDYSGKGETEPSPHFIQNLGEAEYVVATFMYMRLLGYPAEKISILTTYNGQRDLINDVLNQRCSWNPLFGRPASVSTVDRYQGQQNDYILLSLVRTKSVGHLRDVRRLIVSLSRARLGLYVFCRVRLFEECVELQPALKRLLDGRPAGKLWIKCGSSERFDENFSRKIPVAASAVKDTVKEDGGDKKRGRQSKSPERRGKKATGDKEEPAPPPPSANTSSSHTAALDGVLREEGVFAIEGVEHFGSFIHQMTTETIQFLKKQRDERRKQEGQQ